MRKEFHLREEGEGGWVPSDEWEAMGRVAAWNAFSSPLSVAVLSVCGNAVKSGPE